MKNDNLQNYYSNVCDYMTSLHNQLLAALALQGGAVIGCLTAISTIDLDKAKAIISVGIAGFIVEIILTLFVKKIFLQCGKLCDIMQLIESKMIPEVLNTNLEASKIGIKTVLADVPLFTDKYMKNYIVGMGWVFAIGIFGLPFILIYFKNVVN